MEEADVDRLLARLSGRQLTKWMAYFTGKKRVDDLLRDGKGLLDPALAWETVWGPPGGRPGASDLQGAHLTGRW